MQEYQKLYKCYKLNEFLKISLSFHPITGILPPISYLKSSKNLKIFMPDRYDGMIVLKYTFKLIRIVIPQDCFPIVVK